MLHLDHTHWMQRALQLAEKARLQGEVPVGAVLVCNNEILGEGWNQPISAMDPTAHAEIIALRCAAKQQNNYRLMNATLYVTLEPCMMCAGAIAQARIKRVMFGAYDARAGITHHRADFMGGVLQTECSELLKKFFQTKR